MGLESREGQFRVSWWGWSAGERAAAMETSPSASGPALRGERGGGGTRLPGCLPGVFRLLPEWASKGRTCCALRSQIRHARRRAVQICEAKRKAQPKRSKKPSPTVFLEMNRAHRRQCKLDGTPLLLNTIHYHCWMEVANPRCPA